LPTSYKVKHDETSYLAVPGGTDKGYCPTAYTFGLQNSLLLLLLLLTLYVPYTLNRQDTRSNIRAVITYGILCLKKNISRQVLISLPMSLCHSNNLSLITIKRKA